MILAVIAATELVRWRRPVKKIDHTAHLAGLLAGITSIQMYKTSQENSGDRKQRKNLRWFDFAVGDQENVDK
jgi:hypothetical protein